jgi:hypothetical protein
MIAEATTGLQAQPISTALLFQQAPMMTRVLLLLPVLMFATGAAAQQVRNDQGCGRDASRFCRAVLDQGDMVVLNCLKQNRAKLSKICAKVLVDNGQ